jgi:hypothetical protein
MITEIYIENKRLDLSQDLSNEFTYAIDDIQDFASRNTNFSKTIILPGNAVNNKLFGHIFEFTSANFYNPSADNVGYNFNASKAASCVIYVDKIQVFKGIIRLLEITIDRGSIEYECVVFGELGGFVTALNNYKLEELDFSAYDHNWTYPNILNSWEQASGTTASGMGYYYPLIDYGQVSTNKKHWSFRAFRPALFVREYMNKIITGAGYTWESSFFDSNLFKRLVIPNNQKQLSNYVSTQIEANPEGENVSSTGASVTTDLEFPNPSTFIGFEFGVGAYRDFYWTGANFTPTLTFRLIGELTNEQGGTSGLRMHILKNGTIVNTQIVATGDPAGAINFDTTLTYAISLNTNDYFSIQLELYNITGGGAGYTLTSDSFLTCTTNVAVASPLAYGANIFVNSSIPRGIFQRDFVASIVKMFNLYIEEDTDREKHLKITPFIDYYTTTANFLQVNDLEEELLVDDVDLLLLDDYSASHLDWSYKIDRNKPFKIKPMSELNGRFFEFKYKQDADVYNEEYFKKYAEGYADHIEDTGYEFANDKQTTELIFAGTPLLSYQGDDKVYPTIFKRSNTQNTNNVSEDLIDSVIRIMQVRKITGVSSWDLKSDSGNLVNNLTYYGYGGHLDDPDVPTADINFGVPKEIFFSLAATYPSANLYNAFWSDYVAEITDKDSKLLTCNVYLKTTDIYGLDFSKLIYIDGALWRLNKVIDFNPTSPDSTKCEFLKVIELTYE